jgi:hypothetical protein
VCRAIPRAAEACIAGSVARRPAVSTDRRGLGTHVDIEVAPDRVGERRDAEHTFRQIVVCR